MKNKLNVFSNNKIRNFLTSLLSEHELCFFGLESISNNPQAGQANMVVINNSKDVSLVKNTILNGDYLVISNSKSINFKFNFNSIKLIKTPTSTNHIKNATEHFIQNIKVQFHDISIHNEKMTNLNNNSFCYLTKAELEILKCLIKEKQTNKNFIKENILNIKSNIETNSLESHLTRIRKKMNKIKTAVKIQTKSDSLSIIV